MKISALLILSTLIAFKASSQQDMAKKLVITSNYSLFRNQVKLDSSKEMIELKTVIPNIVYDLRYATTNNFMHRLMYPENTSITFLRQPVVAALQKVQQELNEKGLGLKIFDAYRPYSVTRKFWELVH
ncbi:MAG: D-alanyl-D-alanine dipeptidase, partial [Bacteroidia bacterium]|nr:D-alanyl-D-alanine dipeptidase [Bacteroidia bacterium]